MRNVCVYTRFVACVCSEDTASATGSHLSVSLHNVGKFVTNVIAPSLCVAVSCRLSCSFTSLVSFWHKPVPAILAPVLPLIADWQLEMVGIVASKR